MASSAQYAVLYVTEELSCDICRVFSEHLFRCEECITNMCTKCKHEHIRKARRSHNILTIHRQIDEVNQFCKYHDDKEAIRFCMKCKAFICDQCYMKHSSHDCPRIEQVAETMRRKIAGKAGEIDTIDIPRLKSDITSLKHIRQKQVIRNAENLQKIDQQIENLKAMLSVVGEDIKQLYNEQKSNTDQKFEELEQCLNQRLQSAETLVRNGRKMLESNISAGHIINEAMALETEAKTLEQDLIIPKYQDFIPNTTWEQHPTREFLKTLMGKLTPKVEIIKTFKRQDSNIENLCPSKESRVWIHRTDQEKIELVASEGKKIREIKLGFVPNEVLKLSSERMLLSCRDKCRIYTLTKEGVANQFANMSPCKPLGMTVTQDGHIMVCVVEDWTFDITPSSERCVHVLDTTGRHEREIEFDKRGKSMFKLPHTITQSIDGTLCVLDALSETDGRVCFLDSNEKLQNVYSPGNVDNKFYPHAAICDPQGNFIIANSYGNVHLLSKGGQFMCYLLEESDLLLCPLSVTFSSNGLLWVGCTSGKIIISKYIT